MKLLYLKYKLFTILLLVSIIGNTQPNKKYVIFANPISILVRNPTMGLEFSAKNNLFNSIQLEGSYRVRDNKLGQFLYKGFANEKSQLTTFESYPINKIPFMVYNGPRIRLGVLKYFYSKNIHQYVTFSLLAQTLKYDSLEVQYTNTPRLKRHGFYVGSESYSHNRFQNEKLKSVGIGLEYGLRKAYDNVLFNFFVRANVLYAWREITSFNEAYNSYHNGKLVYSRTDHQVYHNTFKLIQLRPELGLRIGLTNF